MADRLTLCYSRRVHINQTGPSQETPPPSLDEVITELKLVNAVSDVDELNKIILELLQWRRAGKDKAESSQSVASRLIGSGETFFKFVNDHAEKSSIKGALRIIRNVLDELGNGHWLLAGLSMIGYMLQTADEKCGNYKGCLDLLQNLVDLSDHVEKSGQRKKFKLAMLMIVKGCILCASEMSHKLSRFLKTNEDLSSFGEEIDSLRLDVIFTTTEEQGTDVFLSHSGKQKNFVRQLYKDLTREGVSCFFDQSRQSLPLAEKWAPLIFGAAKKCRVALLLLSKDFIRSKWPMLELCKFLEVIKSRENSDLKIFPLFYKISTDYLKDLPSDIQDVWTRLGISEEERIEWNKALREVRKFNGLLLKEGEDKVSFRENIIAEIRTLLPPSPIFPSMPVGTVGLAEGQEKVIELLKLTSADTPRLALVISGFGGIGKTTLAEAVVSAIALDLKSYHYTRVDFDIDSYRNDIKIMQKQILNGLFPGIVKKLTSCSEGRNVLAESFKKESTKPIFLFIDNALRKQELDELLPRDMKSLPRGSRILVTTRCLGATDMFIKDDAGIERQKYNVQPLPDQEAKNFLLNGCDDRQLHNIQEDVKRILKVCQGVPLVLEIVRGHLRKQEYMADGCSQILEALERGDEINQEELSKTLTDWVYDQLEKSSKQAFMDICCFFYGMDPFCVEYIVGAQELTSLEEAAFVQRSEHNKTLIVHDIIRERGRNKAKSTRIMKLESLNEAAQDQRLKDVRGVWIKDEPHDEPEEDESEDEPEEDKSKNELVRIVKEKDLKAMKELRVLALGNRMVSQPCEVTFEELRYLEVGCNFPWFPVNLRRLPKLKFYKGPIFKKDFSMYKLPKELRVLIVVHNYFTMKVRELPEELCQMTKLSQLSLSDWRWLISLHAEFGRLTALKNLSLRGCEALQCLPESFGKLTALKDLSLSRCEALQCLPESFGKLTALKDLSLSGCKALQCLPESFGKLRALEYLGLDVCEALEGLPESFGQLAAVEKLNLTKCTALQCLPKSFGELKKLKILYAGFSKALERLPASFGQLAALEKLSLDYQTALQCLPESFGDLKALKDLDLESCKALQCLPESFGDLKALRNLNLGSCEALQCLPESFGQLAALEELTLCCTALQCLPESFGELKALKDLDLMSCERLQSLPESFGQLAALEKLNLELCITLQCLPESFGELKALRDLNFGIPESFVELKALKALERLPESFGQLAAIENLSLTRCTALQRLPESFGELKALKALDLGSCEALERLPESFGELPVVEKLVLSHCTALQCLPESFVGLKALKDLDLGSCKALERLPESFGELKALLCLDLSECQALERLPESFGELKALLCLDLSQCKALKRLPESFAKLKALMCLDMSYSNALERLPESFGELTSLRCIRMANCPARADLSRFEANLKHVTIVDEDEAKSIKVKLLCGGQLTSPFVIGAKKVMWKFVAKDKESRRKALKAIAGVEGFLYYEMGNDEIFGDNSLLVIGNVDPIDLTVKLRKFGSADLLRVASWDGYFNMF